MTDQPTSKSTDGPTSRGGALRSHSVLRGPPRRTGWRRWLGPFLTPASAFHSSLIPPPLALLELFVFIAVIVLEWQIDAFPDLTRLTPHPYWIAILLLSLQYGTVTGVLAATVAIVGAVLIGLPPLDIEERYFNYLLRVWSQPILWLLVALLLGTFRARQIEKLRWLMGEAETLEARGATIVAHANNLKTRINTLERHLAVRDTPPQGRLLAALAALQAHVPGRWSKDFATVADLAFPGASISLYSVEERGLRLKVKHRWPEGATWRQDIDASDPIVEAIVRDRRALNVAERADETVLVGEGVCAVPVIAPDANGVPAVIGMIKIEACPPAVLDENTALRLAVVATHASPALSRGTLQLVAAETVAAAGGASASGTGKPTSTISRVRGLRWFDRTRAAATIARDPVGGTSGETPGGTSGGSDDGKS